MYTPIHISIIHWKIYYLPTERIKFDKVTQTSPLSKVLSVFVAVFASKKLTRIQGSSRLAAVWPEKNCQMSIKVAQNDFTRKIIDFNTFTKIV